MVAIRRHEVRDGRDRVDGGPIEQVLQLVSYEEYLHRNTYLELERDVTRQLATQKYLKRVWFVQDLVWEIEYLPADFCGQTLRLEALDEVYGNRRVLCPGRLEMGRYSSLHILV
jgi:hypothetical protein